MQSEELKPCPFCGGPASVEQYGDRSQSTIYNCRNCSCSLETGEEFNHGAQWNCRAEAALSTAEPVAWLVRLYANDGSLINERAYLEKPDIRSTARTDFVPLYAAPTAPSVAVKVEQPEGTAGEMTPDRAIYFLKRFKGEEKMLGPHEQWALDFSISTLSAQVQDVAESGYSLVQIKAAYIAGYAQGNCLSGTLEGEEEWEEYFSCVVDTAYPASKHGDAE